MCFQIPSWAVSSKQSAQDERPGNPGNTVSLSQEDRLTSAKSFVANMGKTPASARVKRNVSETQKSGDFFTDMPEFKRMKESGRSNEKEFQFSNNSSVSDTPTYKNGHLFRQVPQGGSQHRTEVGSVAQMFSTSQFKAPHLPRHRDKRDSGIFSCDNFAENSLLSVLNAPTFDTRPSDKGKRPTRSNFDTSLPALEIFEKPVDNSPNQATRHSSSYDHREMDQSSHETLARIPHSPKSLTQIKPDLLKQQSTIGTPRPSHYRPRPIPELLDESRDLFADESANIRQRSRITPTVSRSPPEKLASAQVCSPNISEYVSDAIDKFQSPVKEAMEVDDSQKSGKNSDPMITSYQSVVNDTMPSPTVTPNSVTHAQPKTETPAKFSGSMNLKCALYSTSDHSYCKASTFLRMLLTSVGSLSFYPRDDVTDKTTQTTNVDFTPEPRVVERSDSQNSKTPPPKEDTLKLDDVVHFGDTDFVTELEVVDSTPVDSVTGAGDDMRDEKDIVKSGEADCSGQAKISEDAASSPVNSPVDLDPVGSDFSQSTNDVERSGKIDAKSEFETMVNEDDLAKGRADEKRNIIWPDEAMFFVKPPSFSPQQVNETEDMLFQEFATPFPSLKSPVAQKPVDVNPGELVLRIKNSKPIKKSDSPVKKFVPIFTSQRSLARSDKPSGTTDNPIQLSPELGARFQTKKGDIAMTGEEFSETNEDMEDISTDTKLERSPKEVVELIDCPSLQVDVSKQSPFFIVGKKRKDGTLDEAQIKSSTSDPSFSNKSSGDSLCSLVVVSEMDEGEDKGEDGNQEKDEERDSGFQDNSSSSQGDGVGKSPRTKEPFITDTVLCSVAETVVQDRALIGGTD